LTGAVLYGRPTNSERHISKDHLALTSGNGAGKSTLMNILTGVYVWDDGQIQINGSDVYIKEIHKKRGISIGYGTNRTDV
jgi:ABC-type sugar transport system ATPase subunit